MTIRIPGKTFLIGEYAILKGGCALIATHQPFFTVDVKKSNTAPLLFNGASPAGKYFEAHKATFAGNDISFTNPYSMGGLGASTAEFLTLYYLKHQKKVVPVSNKELLECYWQYATSNQGERPSGGDLIAQARGGLCLFNPSNDSHETYAWPFKELSFIIIHTGKKLATHDHLSSLSLQHLPELVALTTSIQDMLQNKDSEAFIKLITNYREQLQKLNLVAPHTQTLLKQLLAMPEVLTAKGCGAMGADTLLIICRHDTKNGLLSKLRRKELMVVATNADIAPKNAL